MEKREEKVRNKFRFFRKLARRRDTPHDMDDLVDLLDSDDDITPKVNETSLDVQERNEEMLRQQFFKHNLAGVRPHSVQSQCRR